MSMTTLTGPSQAPASGRPPRQLVILMHGVGADGNDLIGLAPALAPILPDAEFVSPNAPFPCDMAPFGYQWFSLLERSPERLVAGVRAVAPIVDGFIDEALAERGLTDDKLAVIGFSQGTMTALEVMPRRADPCACLIGFSGALLGADRLPAEVRSRPPVLLVHGELDEVVPVQALPAAVEGLKQAGLAVEAATRPNLPHGIDPEGLKLAAGFLRQHLG